MPTNSFDLLLRITLCMRRPFFFTARQLSAINQQDYKPIILAGTTLVELVVEAPIAYQGHDLANCGAFEHWMSADNLACSCSD